MLSGVEDGVDDCKGQGMRISGWEIACEGGWRHWWGRWRESGRVRTLKRGRTKGQRATRQKKVGIQFQTAFFGLYTAHTKIFV